MALTANAYKDDMERCAQAGMNGYISKPFQPDELVVALGVVISGCFAFDRAGDAGAANESVNDIDWNVIERFRTNSGDEMLSLLVETYLADTAEKLKRLTTIAADPSKREEAMRIAHSLKSASAMSGAKSLSAHAAQLETQLQTATARPAAVDLDEMSRTFSAYRAALAQRGLAAAAT